MSNHLRLVRQNSSKSHSTKAFTTSTAPNDDENYKEMMKLALLPENSRLRFPPPTPPSTARSQTDSFRRMDSNSSTTSTISDQMITKPSPPEWPILQCENIFVLPGKCNSNLSS